MRHLRFILLVVLATALVPGVASAAVLKGTVVKRSAAKTFVLAGASGRLTVVHARRAPRVRRAVTLHGRRLSDGSFRATRVRAGGLRRRARIRGTVAFRSRRSFSVVGRGAELRVRGRSARVGSRVVADVKLSDDGDPTAGAVKNMGDDTDGFELEGTLTAVDTTAGTITITDEDGSGSITVTVPATIDSSGLQVGQKIELSVTQSGGTLTVVRIDGLENAGDDNGNDQAGDNDQADDNGNDQGDDNGNDQSGGSGSSGSGGDDGGSSGSGGGGS
jgi:uncharacterized membrane protein YgcG